MSAPIVAVEIGTNKIVILVGEIMEDNRLAIIGIGTGNSSGIRKGEVINLTNASEAFRIALQNVNQNAKIEIHTVYLCLSGGHINTDINTASVVVADPDAGVTIDDINALKEVARAYQLPGDREIIHSLLQFFTIDDHQVVINPEGMTGNKLSTNALLIHGNSTCIDNTLNVVVNRNINLEDIVFSGMCSAMAVLTDEQKHDGAIVIDIGAGTTDYFVVTDNITVAAGSIAVGGDHITNDLVQAFNIPMLQAEKIKKEYGKAIVSNYNPEKKISLKPQAGFPGKTFSHYALNTVINARIEEILSLVHRRLDEANALNNIGAGIILAGGVAKLEGITLLASEVFGMTCSIGIPQVDGATPAFINSPEYAACCGLLKYGRAEESSKTQGGIFKNFIRRILG